MIAPDVEEIAARLGLRKSGQRWVGRCPECGGDQDSGRFSMKPDGRYYCFACGLHGGRLTWLRKFEKMPCRAAHEAAGVACDASCPRYEDCHESGSRGQKRRKLPLSPEPPSRQVAETTVGVRLYDRPGARWQAWAADHASRCAAALGGRQAALEWLSRRGVSAAAAARFGLGWQNADCNVPAALLGLTVRPGEKSRVWVPGGLVIPTGHLGGPVLRLRHRRRPEDRKRFNVELKYVFINGGWGGPATFNMGAAAQEQPDVLVVVESELDGIAIAAACPDVGVIALGTVRQALTPELDALCRSARWVLVALDADEVNRQGRRPGPDQARLWMQTYDRARFCPVPEGKDPGEFCELGGDLAAWIDSVLAPATRRRRGLVRETGLSGHLTEAQQTAQPAPESVPAIEPANAWAAEILTPAGRIFVTKSRDVWAEYAAQGQPIFSENEIKRLAPVFKGMGPEEHKTAIQAVIDCKAMFGGYIRAGRPQPLDSRRHK